MTAVTPAAKAPMAGLTRVVTGLLALVALATVAIVASGPSVSHDVYWHLATGDAFLERGVPFTQDDLGYTQPDQPLDRHSPPFQVLVSSLENAIGFDAMIVAVRVLAFALMIGAFALFCRFAGASLLVAVVGWCVFLVFAEARAQFVRPELIGMGLALLAFACMERARQDFSSARILPLLLVVVASSFYHSSIMGYIVAFGLFVDRFFRSEMLTSGSARIFFFGWGMIFVLSGFLNWGFSHVLVGALAFEPGWANVIAEFRPALESLSPARFWTWAALCGVAAVGLLAGRQWGYLAILALLGWQALGVSRLVPYATMAAVLGIIVLVSRPSAVQPFFRSRPGQLLGAATVAAALVAVGLMGLQYVDRNAYQRDRLATGGGKPEDVVRYLEQHEAGGNVFVEFQNAGHLSYRLAPAFRTFIDGRTGIFYGFDHFQQYQAMLNDPAQLDSVSAGYGTDFVLLESHPLNLELLHRSDRYGLEFLGQRYFLAAADNPAFASLGALLTRPACFREIAPARLEGELQNALAGDRQPALAELATVVLAIRAGEPTASLAGLSSPSINDIANRLLAFEALAAEDYGLAASAFAAIMTPTPQDQLGLAFGLMYGGRIGDAVRQTQLALRQNAPFALTDGNYRIFWLLVALLRSQQPFDIPASHAALVAGDQLQPRDDADDLVDLFCLTDQVMTLEEQVAARRRYGAG